MEIITVIAIGKDTRRKDSHIFEIILSKASYKTYILKNGFTLKGKKFGPFQRPRYIPPPRVLLIRCYAPNIPLILSNTEVYDSLKKEDGVLPFSCRRRTHPNFSKKFWTSCYNRNQNDRNTLTMMDADTKLYTGAGRYRQKNKT